MRERARKKGIMGRREDRGRKKRRYRTGKRRMKRITGELRNFLLFLALFLGERKQELDT